MKTLISKMLLKIKFQKIFENTPFLILLFPAILVSYLIISTGNLYYQEEIIIKSSIENVMELHENSSLLKNYMPGVISYEMISGESRTMGSIAEITLAFNTNDAVSRKITMKEEVVLSNLPNKKVIIYDTGAIKNKITYRFVNMGDNETKFFRKHEYEFNTYMKITSFFTSKKIKRKSYKYLSSFKEFVENN
jgi:hypothetical protein